MAAGFNWEVTVVGPSSVDAADALTVTKSNNAVANIAAAFHGRTYRSAFPCVVTDTTLM